jgi:hypothetical protein
MVQLDVNIQKLAYAGAWLDTIARIRAGTDRARNLVDRGDFDPADLVLFVQQHPSDRRTWFMGATIDPDVRPRAKQDRVYWRLALGYVVELAARGLTFDEAITATRRRFRTTARRPGFERAARRAFDGWEFWSIPSIATERTRRPSSPTLDLAGSGIQTEEAVA